jgi:hypothetical protein
LASQTLRWEGNVCCVMEWNGGAGGFIAVIDEGKCSRWGSPETGERSDPAGGGGAGPEDRSPAD